MTTWHDVLAQEKEKEYFKQVMTYVSERRRVATVFPTKENMFHALKLTEYDNVKVVILGQDPYHGEHQAHGLSFSVQENIDFPPSLQNIFKELVDDIGCLMPTQGNLTKWAQQGVLLLNTVLTVEKGQAHSHKDKGWEIFTDKVISVLNDRQKPVVFVLWGRPAQSKQTLITNPQHIILTAPHPSPLSAYRGFFGSRPFSRINEYLRALHIEPIDWTLS
ncbi:uracil-DNA glycosylase [Carnobacteriaceae bacterium zg-ZUI78]|uniref:uracil-DNA glycosylase n=1 Tax=Granulicatella sp. zg-84 TaxID=2678503 RepID=UPI0013BEB9D7|nr:uracil-DNA glycosylase [Granulicatella sp. zg-84]MBS4750885.1 uracil-DNA glycosylase [Carnobacteriaceae bacterium zg-ZUI78]NEW65548.1 uracil-DNA glycosylase [Granulicatella sp. zg-84]QMI85570.1 uracil-DNA glycosylase [Carnobacteriaceae bacterium zg-84]